MRAVNSFRDSLFRFNSPSCLTIARWGPVLVAVALLAAKPLVLRSQTTASAPSTMARVVGGPSWCPRGNRPHPWEGFPHAASAARAAIVARQVAGRPISAADRTSLHDLAVKHHVAIFAILTADQRTQLEANLAARRNAIATTRAAQ